MFPHPAKILNDDEQDSGDGSASGDWDVHDLDCELIGSFHNLVTWYGINHAGTQVAQWDFQNKGKYRCVTSVPA